MRQARPRFRGVGEGEMTSAMKCRLVSKVVEISLAATTSIVLIRDPQSLSASRSNRLALAALFYATLSSAKDRTTFEPRIAFAAKRRWPRST